MPRTPKATDGEAPKKRTSKATSKAETDTNALKTKTSAPKSTKSKAAKLEVVAAPAEVVTTAVAKPAQESAPAPVVNAVLTMPSLEERIRARAYELYLRRGGRGGSPEQDWFQAAAEVYGESVA